MKKLIAALVAAMFALGTTATFAADVKPAAAEKKAKKAKKAKAAKKADAAKK